MKSYVVDGVFTPRASVKKGVSAYTPVHPQQLVVACLNALRERQPEVLSKAETAFFGCVSQVNDQGANIARNAVLSANLDWSVSASSVNMCCGSGLQAVSIASALVASGTNEVAIGGGVESMSRVKMASDGGYMDGNNEVLRRRMMQVPQGISADYIAASDGFTREELDEFSLSSHRKAHVAAEKKYFEAAYAFVRDESGNPLLTRDDHIRPETSMDGLSQLKPAFAALEEELIKECVIGEGKAISKVGPFHTAGNSSGIADGASAIIVANEDFVARSGVKPRARILKVVARGSDPIVMLNGPSACCTEVLKDCGMSPQDIDLWEINEAFAVVPLQTMRNLGLDPAKVNVNGGAIALGHPLGATGSILLVSLITALEREDKNVGCVTLCVAGGQSISCVIERV
ncbi:MAG: acetyl-CoA C-acyltransferase [Candidatus Obscuribacterales bacterium]|nr:acetyl-CoA C-acyltransferase [Candidatus Obscuribacterales bacterium]